VSKEEKQSRVQAVMDEATQQFFESQQEQIDPKLLAERER